MKRGSNGKEMVDPALVAAQIAQQMREPFQAALLRMLEAAPDVKDIREFAKKYPDRWAQAVAITANLSGYNKESTVHHKHRLMHDLTDVELMAAVEAARAAPPPITVVPEPVEEKKKE